jgi:hypothetical protein
MSAIEDAVIEKIRQRADAGLKKYGVTMERGDLSTREWLVHAQEEALDLCVYLERAIQDLGAQHCAETFVSNDKPSAKRVEWAKKEFCEMPKAVDLSKCKRGDKLRRRDGTIVEFDFGCAGNGCAGNFVGGWWYDDDGRRSGIGGESFDIIEVIGQ